MSGYQGWDYILPPERCECKEADPNEKGVCKICNKEVNKSITLEVQSVSVTLKGE